jgi:hypothetical protein
MTDEYQLALDRVRAYAEKIRMGERAADQESLDRAADLARIYEDKRWIAEEAAAGRAPKTETFRGRPNDPAARHRFGTWLYKHGGLGPSQTTRLLKANDWRQTYSAVGGLKTLTGENAIRPLFAIERRGRASFMPEVISRAQEIAGDGEPVTSAHTKQAVREFWEKYSAGEKRRMDRDAQAKQHATKARREMLWLVENGYLKTFAELLTELDAVGEKAAS